MATERLTKLGGQVKECIGWVEPQYGGIKVSLTAIARDISVVVELLHAVSRDEYSSDNTDIPKFYK